MKIAFIGCGKLGLPCAEAIVRKGHTVKGYDIAPVKSDLVFIKDTIQEAVEDAGIVFVAVPTPHEQEYDGRLPTAHLPPKDFNYDIVKDVLIETNKHMNKRQLLCLISTVIPGTVRSILQPLITNTRFVYNPYLIAMGSVAWDMINPEMVMIGTEDGTETGDAKELVDFYKTIMENDPRYEIGTWDECECIKVFYNTFISAKLSLVNMIQDVAMKQGNINADVVCTALANSDKRIMGPQYMTPGMGDGGACHPRDNIALRHMAQKLDLGYDLFDSIMNAREKQAKNMAEFLVAKAKESDLPVLIHGVAYKPNVEYLDGSYSTLVSHYCEQMGYYPIMVDPLTHPQIGPFKAVALLGHSAETTYRYTNQKHEDQMYCYLEPGSIVIDPWRKFNKNTNEYTVIYYGDTRNVEV